jgi:hypothetical protein
VRDASKPTAGQAGAPLTILNVSGPYREPRELAFSYDFSFQRSHWPTAQAARLKVSIPEELDYLKVKILGASGGSPGQQLRINQILSRHIADQKFKIVDEEGWLTGRRDVMVDPFTGQHAHLFERLSSWMEREKDALRREIKEKVGL